MVLVRLTLFKKTLEECGTLEDKLIFSLCHAHEFKGKPPQFREEVFDKIFSLARISSFTIKKQSFSEIFNFFYLS